MSVELRRRPESSQDVMLGVEGITDHALDVQSERIALMEASEALFSQRQATNRTERLQHAADIASGFFGLTLVLVGTR